MSAPPQSAFTFPPNPTLQQYQTSWRECLDRAKCRLADLEVPRMSEKLDNYLRELDAFHLRSAADTDAEIWTDFHPDQSFREEAKIANKAATDLYSLALASSGLAANLALFEETHTNLDKDAARFLKLWKEDLVNGGAYLDPEDKGKLLRLNRAIEECIQEFYDNIRNDLRILRLDVQELPGIPDDYLSVRTVDESVRSISVTAKAADVASIQGYCQRQATRERVYRFAGTEASPINEQVLKRLLTLRAERAVLLGLSNAAEYEMRGTMAGSVEEVKAFLDEVHEAVDPIAAREKDAIRQSLRDQDGIDLRPWDVSYGVNRLKNQTLSGFDIKASRQYFQVAKAFPALQRIAQTLFSLRFDPIQEEFWHPSVTAALVYDVADDSDSLLGRIFFDMYPREGKVDGAAAYTARRPIQGQQLGEVILYANMPDQEGACISWREVQTILHELGHCSHALLSAQAFDRLSGIDFVPMDFIEAPSQMLELWLTDATVFDFAVNAHGESIPDTLLQQLIDSEGVGRAMRMRDLLCMSKYCLELHIQVPQKVTATTDIVAAVFNKYGNFDLEPGLAPQHGLWHIASESYGSRVYSYLFSQVICQDIFSEFRKTGSLMDKQTALRYRRIILEKGSSEDPKTYIEEFLGRKYDVRAFKDWLKAGQVQARTI